MRLLVIGLGVVLITLLAGSPPLDGLAESKAKKERPPQN
jgi:hypothetical protein